MRSILSWIGGKSGSCKKIVELMPPHNCYVEAFSGGLWVLFEKQPAKVEILNDVNHELINFWRTIQRQPNEFVERSKYEMHSREIYDEYYADFHSGAHAKLPTLERAFRFFIMIKCSYSAKFDTGWGYSSVQNQAVSLFNQFKIIDQIALRLKNCQIDNNDFEKVIIANDKEDTVVFCCLPETKVRMLNEKLLNIENINVGDKVFAGNKVLNTMCREYNGTVYEFELMGIYDNLHVTEEHPLLIVKEKNVYEFKTKERSKFLDKDKLDNITVNWSEAKNIEIGDFLLSPCYPENILNIETVKIGNTTVKCDEELGWVLGFWLAEGHINHIYHLKNCMSPDIINSIKSGKQNTIYNYSDFDTIKINEFTNKLTNKLYEENSHESSYSLCYTCGELDFTCGFIDRLNKWYSKNFNGKATAIRKAPDHEAYQIFYYVEEMAKFLHDNFGEIATNKKICNDFLNYPIEFQKGLLRGWLDGDGGIYKGTQNRVKITGTTVSKQLAINMYSIALRLGLRPALKQRGKEGKRIIIDRECDVHIAWDLYFSSTDVRFIYPEHFINLNNENNEKITKGNLRSVTSKDSIERTKRRIITKGNLKFIITPVTNIIKREYSGKVYNLTTENHVYVSNYVLSHNCDPPYIGADPDSEYFKSMGANNIIGFGLNEHQKLYRILKALKGKFILTIDNNPWIRERYCEGENGKNGFWWIENEVFYCARDKDNREHVVELIITNYDTNKVIKQKKLLELKAEEKKSMQNTRSLADF